MLLTLRVILNMVIIIGNDRNSENTESVRISLDVGGVFILF